MIPNRSPEFANKDPMRLSFAAYQVVLNTGYRAPESRIVRDNKKKSPTPVKIGRPPLPPEVKAAREAAQRKQWRENAKKKAEQSPNAVKLAAKKAAQEQRRMAREALKAKREADKADKAAQRAAKKASVNKYGTHAEYLKIREKINERNRMQRIDRIFANGPVTISQALEIDQTSHRSSMSGLMVFWRSLGLVDVVSMDGKVKTWGRK